MSWKTLAILSAGPAAGSLIHIRLPVSDANAMTADGQCWVETRNDAKKFEDAVNVKDGEGF